MWGGILNPRIPTFLHSISPKPHLIFVKILISRKFPNPQSPPKMFQSPDFSEPIFWSYNCSRTLTIAIQMFQRLPPFYSRVYYIDSKVSPPPCPYGRVCPDAYISEEWGAQNPQTFYLKSPSTQTSLNPQISSVWTCKSSNPQALNGKIPIPIFFKIPKSPDFKAQNPQNPQQI